MDRDAVAPKTWIAIIGASLGAFMAVLNIQIVNASLADIQGAIGAGIDDGGWISTSYLIAEIVVIPLTGWLAQVFSVRSYLLANAVLFLVFSVACAFATTLKQMIVLRALQGFTGGVLIPMAFTLIITLLPKAKQPIGLALFAVSATFAPAIGPTIGGYLTENWGWQYIFYVNLVPGAVMLAMLWFSLERAPMQLALLRTATGAASPPWRSDSPRCRRCSRKATRTTGSARQFIVRSADHRRRRAGAVRVDRTHYREAAAEPAPARAPQLRFRHRRELPARHRAVRLGVRPAGLSVAHPGLQRGADRHGAGVDRPAAAVADPAGAAADETLRCARC